MGKTVFKDKWILATGGLVSVVVVSGVSLTTPVVRAVDVTDSADTTTIIVSSSCSITGTVNSEHTATIVNGHYQNNIGQTTIKAFCNDANGYAIYAIGFSGDSHGNTDIISGLSESYNIATGTATSGTTSDWAMKVNSVSGTYAPTIANGFDSYHVVPSNYTKVASFGAKTDNAATQNAVGSSITTTYAAYISSSQLAGTYTGKVKYVLVHPAGAAVPIVPYMQTVGRWADLELPVAGDSIQAIDQRDGKKYWVTRMKDGSVWMTQNLDLDLVNVESGDVLLSSKNTDLNVYNTDMYTQGYTTVNNTIYWNPQRSTYSGSTITWESNNTSPFSADLTDKFYYTSSSNSKDTVYNSLENCKLDHSEGDCMHYHNGNYYNWTAAVASNYKTSTPEIAENSICPKNWRLPIGGTSNIAYAAYAGSGYSEFSKLLFNYNVMSSLDFYGSNDEIYLADGYIKIRATPLYFTRGGAIESTASLNNAGATGYYWTSSSNTGAPNYGVYLKFTSTLVDPKNGAGIKSSGYSVRCVMRDDYVDIDEEEAYDGYIMQQVADWASELSTGDEVEAMDIRDGKIYTVAKLADGNIWMTQNLDHDIGDIEGGTYTSSDTDIPSDWTPSDSAYTKESSDTTWATGSTGWSIPQSYDPGDVCWDGQSGSSKTIAAGTESCGDDKHYHLGNYYNFTAAIAMSDSSSLTSGGTVDQSICPAGWMLPRGGSSSGSYGYLKNQLGLSISNLKNSPVYFVYSDSYGTSSSSIIGYNLRYMPANYYDGTEVSAFYLDSDGVMAGDYYSTRSDGVLVRCVARSS